jgi:NADP-dependent 3-hydroxy acid dehydrogenase YdfG
MSAFGGVIVSGASTGIGEATVTTLAQRGFVALQASVTMLTRRDFTRCTKTFVR